MLEQHEVFQMYYYAHHVGPESDRHRRELFKAGDVTRARLSARPMMIDRPWNLVDSDRDHHSVSE